MRVATSMVYILCSYFYLLRLRQKIFFVDCCKKPRARYGGKEFEESSNIILVCRHISTKDSGS